MDINEWGYTWLGSQTVLSFITEAGPCIADLDTDGDVDGKDLVSFIDAYTEQLADADIDENNVIDENDIKAFAEQYGKTNCAIQPQ